MKKITSQQDLKTIYDTEFKKLMIQDFRIVNKQDVAEDIVQECFIKLWQKRNDISTDISIATYIKKMVRNRCLDYLRKNKIRTVEVNDNLNIEIEENANEVRFEKNEKLQRKIQSTLNSLPEKCRQVFVLAKYEKFTYKQISEKLEIAPKTVEAHMSKALKSFRTNLKQFLIIILKRLRVL